MNFDTIDECDHAWVPDRLPGEQEAGFATVWWCPRCNIRKVENDTEIHYFYIVKKRTEFEKKLAPVVGFPRMVTTEEVLLGPDVGGTILVKDE